jgi:nucleoid-associated protein YgaU
MFARDGTPVRSTMSLRLQEYAEVSIDVREGLFLGSPTASRIVNQVVVPAVTAAARRLPDGATAILHTVLQGETLSGIAGVYLGDPGRWREIAQLNAIDDPLALRTGTSLVVPGPGGGQTPGRAP